MVVWYLSTMPRNSSRCCQTGRDFLVFKWSKKRFEYGWPENGLVLVVPGSEAVSFVSLLDPFCVVPDGSASPKSIRCFFRDGSPAMAANEPGQVQAESDESPESAYDDGSLEDAGAATHAVKVQAARAEKEVFKPVAKRNDRKEERAQAEGAVDKETRILLFKLVDQGAVPSIDGCISTGKEANVYLAGESVAVKVLRTTTLSYKGRANLVEGDRRFAGGFAWSSPKQVARTWALKEYRNMRRMNERGVTCPVPHFLRKHVLGMELITDSKGRPAPLLKHAADRMGIEEMDSLLYIALLPMMRTMYQSCRLVHGDLSEYNLLVTDDGRLHVIDVGQAVEIDHPLSHDLLRSDLGNCFAFFSRRGVQCPPIRHAFAFVADEHVKDEVEALDHLRERADQSDESYDDPVFRACRIPRTLLDVHDCERDAEALRSGPEAAEEAGAFSATLAGLMPDLSGVRAEPAVAVGVGGGEAEDESARSDEQESGSDIGGDEEGESERERKGVAQVRVADMSKEEAKEHKRRVKEERRERRKDKMPKHVKKRSEHKGDKKKRR